MKEQKISLYVVPGVPEDYPFETKTRKEISVWVFFPSANTLVEYWYTENRMVQADGPAYLETQ